MMTKDEAIKILQGIDRLVGDDFYSDTIDEAIEMAIEAPKADRPRGEWLDENGTYYANCSKCGYQMDTHQERGYFRYCPNCGADMRPTERSEE